MLPALYMLFKLFKNTIIIQFTANLLLRSEIKGTKDITT